MRRRPPAPEPARNDVDDVRERVRKMVAAEGAGERIVTKVLGRELGL
jgi:hypothetical protein